MPTAQRLVDLSRVESEVGKLTLGQREIDLSDVEHNRAAHADMVAWSGLGWWLMAHSLAASGDPEPLAVVLPKAGSAPMRFLGRTGLVTAAANRSARLGYSDKTEFDWTHLYSDLRRHSPRLPGVAWEPFDELDGDQLRVVSDLASPRRQVPKLAKCGLHYPWLDGLRLASPAISYEGLFQFVNDADVVVSELIDNVHKWSQASEAYAVLSVTRGGARRDDRRVSWNRLHVIVADNGIGIPTALHNDAAAYSAVRDAGGYADWAEIADIDLLRTLVFRAFGERQIPNHNGYGLHATQARATKWVGALDIMTTDRDGRVMRLGTRGLVEEDAEIAAGSPELSGAQGTLIHVMLQAVDEEDVRAEAAQAEHLPFSVSVSDEASDLKRDAHHDAA
ncbi:hypothetical protein [Candidatus Poriferisodalis sp.]|uniref:hypothetical protein n=1 Tax=Candidatus Poriferisodalis sp. TaxID=3101277 RepID=UPI003B011853